jgi:hypothetical protein
MKTSIFKFAICAATLLTSSCVLLNIRANAMHLSQKSNNHVIFIPTMHTLPNAMPPATIATPTPINVITTAPTPTIQNVGNSGTVITGCAQTGFINVTQNAKNTAYAAPSLKVTCSGSNMTIESNGIPEFEFVQTTPNRLIAQNYRWVLPINPQRATTTTAVPLGGVSAIAVDGLPIFGPTEAPRDGYKDPYLQGILDFCNGHTAQRGDYHFHARPGCLNINFNKPGTIVGYALDGFPILTNYVCADANCTSTKKLKSSWQKTNPNVSNAWQQHSYVAGSGDLDQCNGATQPNGSYAYYATDSFPYFMGCYMGTKQ